MMEWMRHWLLGISGAAVVCAVCGQLTPKGPVKQMTETLCGLVLTLALLSPLLELDLSAYALNLARYREAGAALTEEASEISRRLDRRVIEEELRAYILDKAAALTDARVELAWSTEGLWVPVAAELWGPYDPTVEAVIESELGIPAEKQTWRAYGAD